MSPRAERLLTQRCIIALKSLLILPSSVGLIAFFTFSGHLLVVQRNMYLKTYSCGRTGSKRTAMTIAMAALTDAMGGACSLWTSDTAVVISWGMQGPRADGGKAANSAGQCRLPSTR